MKKLFLSLCLILVSFTAFAQQKAVAVSTFTNGRGISAESANTITNLVIGRLTDNGMVRIVDRASFDKILAEMRFQQSDWSDSEKTAALGRAVSADYIIRGEIDLMDGRIIITARMIDILSARVEASSDIEMDRMAEARSKMPEFVDRFIQTLARTGGNPRPGSGEQTGSGSNREAFSHLERGKRFHDREDYDAALAEFTEAIRIDPNYAEAYYHRGYAYDDKDDYDRAIADFTQAIRINPNYEDAYCYRGLAYHNKDDYDRAITDYTQAIRLDPNYEDAYYYRGLAYYDKKDYDRAITDYTQAIKLDPNDKYNYNGRGEAYLSKRDYDKAIADFTQAIRIDPNYADAKRNLETARKRGR